MNFHVAFARRVPVPTNPFLTPPSSPPLSPFPPPSSPSPPPFPLRSQGSGNCQLPLSTNCHCPRRTNRIVNIAPTPESKTSADSGGALGKSTRFHEMDKVAKRRQLSSYGATRARSPGECVQGVRSGPAALTSCAARSRAMRVRTVRYRGPVRGRALQASSGLWGCMTICHAPAPVYGRAGAARPPGGRVTKEAAFEHGYRRPR